MSYLEISFKQTVKTLEFPEEGGYLAEVFKYKKKRSGCVGQFTKTINKIENCFSENSLDEIVAKIRLCNNRIE